MVETRDWNWVAVDIGDLKAEAIINYLENNLVVVIVKQGKYVGIINEAILNDRLNEGSIWRQDHVIYRKEGNSKELFIQARIFYKEIKNREWPLPVIDENGVLKTFFVWNQNLEKSSQYLWNQKRKLLELLQRGNKIEFRNWDEYTDDLFAYVVPHAQGNNIKCSGKHWDLCSAFGGTEWTDEAEYDRVVVAESRGISYPVSEHTVTPLYGISDKFHRFSGKKIYAWINNTTTLYFLSSLIFQDGYFIDGFCELSKAREVWSLLGKPVENLEDAASREDVLILVYKNKEKVFLENYLGKNNIVHIGELYGWDLDIMAGRKFRAWGSESDWQAFMRDKPVAHMDISMESQNGQNTQAMLLWEYMYPKTVESYEEYIEKIDKNVQWFSRSNVYETTGMTSCIQKLVSFDKALENNKKFIIYGIESHYTNQWMHMLESWMIPYELMEDEEIEDWYGYHVNSIYDLPYYDLERVFVIVNKPYAKLRDALAILSDYQITFERANAVCIYECMDNQNRGGYGVDMCAGPVPLLMMNSEYPGYVVFGDNGRENYKIMVLGGSTTDSTLYNYKSWPQFLYEKLKQSGKRVTIFNGAVGGYASIQECTKMTRDTRYIKPDMVISFSGVNDSGESDLQPGYTYGLEGAGNYHFENWLFNEEVMKTVAERCGAEFLCFAQPQIYEKKELDKYERLRTKIYRLEGTVVPPRWRKEIKTIKEGNQYPWIIDLTDILDHEDVYVDNCHVNSDGNEIIADHIYNYIVDRV